MTPVEYARMAEKCRDEADAMAPSPERDELLKKAKLFESYAKMENWAALLDTERMRSDLLLDVRELKSSLYY